MKKVLFLFVLVVMFGNFLPVAAKGEALSLSVVAPESAGSGETIEVVLTAANTDRGAKTAEYTVVFPRSTVAWVEVAGGGKKVKRSTSDAQFVFTWKEVVKPGKNANLSFRVTLSAAQGSVNLLEVKNQIGTVLLQKNITLSVQELAYEILSPIQAMYGSRPIEPQITVYNPNSTDMTFDLSVYVFLVATNKSMQYSNYGGVVYGFEGDGSHTLISWSGSVHGHEKYILTLTTASGIGLGTYDFLIVTDLQKNVEIGRSQITLITGSGDPYGVMNLTNGYGPLVAGGSAYYEPEYFSPTPVQFVSEASVSTCPMIGLPGGYVSYVNVSYANPTYTVTILPMEKPDGAVDPYYVTCNISTKFYFWGNPSVKYTVSYDFQVLIP